MRHFALTLERPIAGKLSQLDFGHSRAVKAKRIGS
jgi:hypothetical protein